MCAVSAVGDAFRDNFNQKYPHAPWQDPNNPWNGINFPNITQSVPIKLVTQAEFDALKLEFDAIKLEVEAMKIALNAAAKYDVDNNEPHCEMDEKVELIKQIAKFVGVDLGDVFKQ